MNYAKELSRWAEQATQDSDIAREISQLMLLPPEHEDIRNRFYRTLAFGTGGLRGILGAGPNRMNVHVVRQATQGVAEWLMAGGRPKRVAIAHDTRNKSGLFALEAAIVLAGNGITALLYPQPLPTPALSFAVRRLNCGAGICVTASHNPAEYNGYKVYGPDGCQITEADAAAVSEQINRIEIFDVPRLDGCDDLFARGLIQYISQATVTDYIKTVLSQTTAPPPCPLSVAYTPLHGAGLGCVSAVLAAIQVDEVHVVAQQAEPDGNFPTAPYPNPELLPALQLGLKLCCETGTDLLLATDPDCDRVGVAAKDTDGEYRIFSGNEVGVLLLDYLCRARIAQGTMPKRPLAIKTIVTSRLAEAVCKKYGVELAEVFTGFKYIGEMVSALEKKGEEDRFIFGFEESCGYLCGSDVRDKDGVLACMLVCEMARWHKANGETLPQALKKLYREHSYEETRLLSYTFVGETGAEKIRDLMGSLRSRTPEMVGGLCVTSFTDYHISRRESGLVETINAAGATLSGADVVRLDFEAGGQAIFRPSGTEPMLKVYLSVVGGCLSETKSVCDNLALGVEGLMETVG
jgi:phosphoglucomutase